MAHNSIYGAQPFEELGNEQEPTSPTSLEDFYREQEKKDLERKLSKRRSLRQKRGRSKSFASTSDAPLSPDTESARSPTRPSEEPKLEPLPEATAVNAPPSTQQLSWHREREQTGQWYAPEHEIRQTYEIHNPVPPPIPWTNHHLRPPGAPWPPTSQPRKVVANPNVVGTGSTVRDVTGIGSGNASSTSFIKTASATNLLPPAIYGPDHIDMLDPSDPWGMRWHHDGRYDVGDFTTSTRGKPTATWAGTSSPAVEIPPRPRTRGGSPNGPSTLRSSVKSPSPLSQSTSAGPMKNGSSISLDTPKQLQRRLSKRNSSNMGQPVLATDQTFGTKRISGFRSLFASNSQPVDRQRSKTLGSASAPPTAGYMGQLGDDSARPMSTLPPSVNGQRTSLSPSPTKDKRSSYLGRLVKKFSIIRHSSEPDPKVLTAQNQHPGLKRSVSTANGIYAQRPADSGSHPKFASAPAGSDSPIGVVPELRLVQPNEGEDDQKGQAREGAPIILNDDRPLSDARNSPEPHFAQFGGLVVTNPDAMASESESISKDSPPRRRRLKSAPSASPAMEFDSLPRPAFMRGIGSNESSPSVRNVPLRVVNGREADTETETGTILGEIVASPAPTMSTIPPPVPSPTDKRRSLQSGGEPRTIPVVPSISDLPLTSPPSAARSIVSNNSFKSSDMATALETLSPPASSVSLSSSLPVKTSTPSPRTTPESAQRPLSNYSAAPSVATTMSTMTNLASTIGDEGNTTPTRRSPPSLASGSEDFVRPTPRAASLANSSSSTRYGAYYSPNAYPTLSVPSTIKVDPNPLPTPPARLPMPLVGDNSSRERLQGGSSREQLPSSSSREQLQRAPSKERLKSKASKGSGRDIEYWRADLQGTKQARRIEEFGRRESAGIDIREWRNQTNFRVPAELLDPRPSQKGSKNTLDEQGKEASTEKLNPSRAPIENGYNVTSSRPKPAHSQSYHLPTSQRDSDRESEPRKRTNSTAGSDQKSSSQRDEPRRRTNSTRSGAPSSSSGANGPAKSDASSSKPSILEDKPMNEEKKRAEPVQESGGKQVISGFGQTWEVIEAVMIQPSRNGSRRQHSRDMSGDSVSTISPTSPRPLSNGMSSPPRTSSRPGYNAAGEPIGLKSKSPSISSTAPSLPPKRMPSVPVKNTARSSQPVRGPEKERSKTMDVQPSQSRSKSRPREMTPSPPLNLNKPQPPRPPPTPAQQPAMLPNGTYSSPSSGRRDSLQKVRPTSEVVNTPELSAQEAWEHDRMTGRGQSVYSPDGIVAPPTSSYRTSANSSLLQSVASSSGGVGAGSAHTSFVVQPPFQPRSAPPTQTYYPNHYPIPNPLPAPPATILPPKSAARNRI
ncbi:hypothetical protein PIIN_01887 [Serendipita indica DSM 11827]|uniref:Uncharacterized protein n=1 Tax=Serendipita indica (strain DSM 11827) TaxID=1109443 RepID=G4T9P9_SERID|nr:hypothetical protein PIIN_01887 [Serendipita indica DSM 11827]